MESLPQEHLNYYKKFCKTTESYEKCLGTRVSSWSFGDSPKMADELLAYVLSGEKTATTGLLISQEYYSEGLPEVGERSIILDSQKQPRCIIETIYVEIMPYNRVEEDFALKEGEGFKTLRDWQEAHTAFFIRECKRMNLIFDETMEVVCEEFRIIYR